MQTQQTSFISLLKEAAENAVNLLETRLSGHGGVIAIDSNGNIGKAFNTDLMAWASIKNNTLEWGLQKKRMNYH